MSSDTKRLVKVVKEISGHLEALVDLADFYTASEAFAQAHKPAWIEINDRLEKALQEKDQEITELRQALADIAPKVNKP